MDTGLYALKTSSKKVIHKAPEPRGELTGNKTAENIVKTKHVPAKNPRNVEGIIIPPEKRKEIFNELRKVL